jgi:hypothetical protein
VFAPVPSGEDKYISTFSRRAAGCFYYAIGDIVKIGASADERAEVVTAIAILCK